MTPKCILDQAERLTALCNKHPQEIPLKDAAEYLFLFATDDELKTN